MTKEKELEHRLTLIQNDLNSLIDILDDHRLMETMEKHTKDGISALKHIVNLEIACDLKNNESLSWKPNKNQNPKVKESIDTLKSIDIDAETMQYIIEELGMQEQIIKQLVGNYPNLTSKQLINYNKEFPMDETKRAKLYPLVTKAQDLKLMILYNYIDYYTSDDLERIIMKDNAYFYVLEDYCNELESYEHLL